MDEVYFVKSVRVAVQEAQRTAFKRWGGIAEIWKVKRGVIKGDCRTVRVRLAVGDNVDWFVVTVVKSQNGWVVQRGGKKMAKLYDKPVFSKGSRVRLARYPHKGMLEHPLEFWKKG